MMNLCVNIKPWPIGSGCMSGSGALTGWYQLEAQFDTTSYNMHVPFKQLCAPMLRASGYIARLRLELVPAPRGRK
jgi:MFS superfamily sulfate permease-like transporter